MARRKARLEVVTVLCPHCLGWGRYWLVDLTAATNLPDGQS